MKDINLLMFQGEHLPPPAPGKETYISILNLGAPLRHIAKARILNQKVL